MNYRCISLGSRAQFKLTPIVWVPNGRLSSLQKQPSFVAHGPSGISQEGHLDRERRRIAVFEGCRLSSSVECLITKQSRSSRDLAGSSDKSDSALWSVLKFVGIANYFMTEWFSWMGIVLVLATIVIHSCTWNNSSFTSEAPFSNATPAGSFQTQNNSGQVLVNKCSKWKRILLKRSCILHLQCIGFLETV